MIMNEGNDSYIVKVKGLNCYELSVLYTQKRKIIRGDNLSKGEYK